MKCIREDMYFIHISVNCFAMIDGLLKQIHMGGQLFYNDMSCCEENLRSITGTACAADLLATSDDVNSALKLCGYFWNSGPRWTIYG